MYAQCPECLTFFHLKPSHLKAANGRVRCSRCKHVFNALETLRDELTPEEIAAVEAARRRESKTDAPTLHEEYAGDLFDRLEYSENAELGLDTPRAERPAPVAPDRHVHDFSVPRKPRRHSALLAIANLLLLLGLAAQIVHWQRFEILEHPQAGPYLARAYDEFGLDLSPPRDIAALKVSRTEVGSHPDHPRALHLTAVLENAGRLAQPWPQLHVDLQDRWGETVATRYFEPAEYLRAPESAGQPLRAGERHAIELTILDPGSAAVGFQIETCFATDSGNDTRHVCSADVNPVQ
jgi:predicted Zn finger-like uncharacterized protein